MADSPEFARGGIIPAGAAGSGDEWPPWLTGCRYGERLLRDLAAVRGDAIPLFRRFQERHPGGDTGLAFPDEHDLAAIDVAGEDDPDAGEP